MSQYTLRFRTINKDIFLDIKSGKKTVETRAATTKYKNIKDGDVIELVCGKERFKKEIKKAKIFKTISALTKKYSVKSIMPNISSTKELQEAYFSYPNYRQKIKKHGIIALELK